jgi:hypothetical protein
MLSISCPVRVSVCLSNFLCLGPVVCPSVLRTLLPTNRKDQCGFPEESKNLVGTRWNDWSDSVARTGVGFRQQADCSRHGWRWGQEGGVFVQALWYCITKTSQLILCRAIISLLDSITKYVNILWATRSDFVLKQATHIFTVVLYRLKLWNLFPHLVGF